MRTKFSIISICISVIILLNCSNKKTTKEKIIQKRDSIECKVLYKKYNKKFLSEENDSALIYINKAIKCDPKNNNYKNTKVMFLIGISKYNDAIIQLDELIVVTKDPAFKLLKGILMLKIKNPKANTFLNEVYNDYKIINEPTSSNLFYKIALDNYFKNKEYSLEQVQKFKKIYENMPYENQNISALEDLINKETKGNVLFKLFNIN